MNNFISFNHKIDLFFKYLIFFTLALYSHTDKISLLSTHNPDGLIRWHLSMYRRNCPSLSRIWNSIQLLSLSDTTLIVCCNTIGIKRFVLARWGMTSVPKLEFSNLIYPHYNTSSNVRQEHNQVSVLADVFDITFFSAEVVLHIKMSKGQL